MERATVLLFLGLVSTASSARAGAIEGNWAEDLKSDVPAVRAGAARRLGERGGGEHVTSLIALLGDPEARVRWTAAAALGTLRDPRAAEPLVEALRDRDRTVRFHAAHALGQIASPAGADGLVRALSDPEWPVRSQAAGALRRLADPKLTWRLAAGLKADGADTELIIWLLKPRREAAVKPVAKLLGEAEASVRRRAAVALGKLGGEEAVDALIAALTDKTPSVRGAAVAGLVALGDRRAAEPVAELAQREADPGVRRAAAAAAERLARNEDLLAHWSFDGRGPAAGRDVTGGGNDGKVIGCRPAPGKVGGALRFGKERYVELGKPAGLPIGQQPFTIAAWVRPEAPTGVVVARGGAFCGFSLYVKDGLAKFGIHREEAGPGYIAAGREKLGEGWVHLAGVVKKDRIELYVNGRLAATTRTAGYLPGNCGQGMEIGFDVGNSAAEISDAFEGVIDEVRMYRTALTAEEIAALCRPPERKQPREK